MWHRIRCNHGILKARGIVATGPNGETANDFLRNHCA